MAIILKKYDLSVLLAPKAASTTIKHVAFFIENGRPFEPYYANSRHRQVHQLYHSRLFKFEKELVDWNASVFAVIRDPIERLLSCHANRVLELNELDKVQLTEADVEKGVVARPDFETFVAHLGRYRQLSDKIRHHSLPLERFLGGRADRYTGVFDCADLTGFWDMLRTRVGRLPEIPRDQRSAAAVKARTITRATLARIQELFAKDYDVFGKFLAQTERTYQVT
ncbi:MAG: sulfotransferase family 2 domain-containing protein [Pseudomonadota bacterium]